MSTLRRGKGANEAGFQKKPRITKKDKQEDSGDQVVKFEFVGVVNSTDRNIAKGGLGPKGFRASSPSALKADRLKTGTHDGITGLETNNR